MEFYSERFGTLEADDSQIITFENGLPQLEHLHRFLLLNEEEIPVLHWLQSIDLPSMILPLLNVFGLIDAYAVDLEDEDIADLRVEHSEDLLLMNVCVIPEDLQRMTANLAAPIIINVRQMLGKQIILGNPEYATRYPIYEAFKPMLEGKRFP